MYMYESGRVGRGSVCAAMYKICKMYIADTELPYSTVLYRACSRVLFSKAGTALEYYSERKKERKKKK